MERILSSLENQIEASRKQKKKLKPGYCKFYVSLWDLRFIELTGFPQREKGNSEQARKL